jgi:hypothetical protein
MRYTRRRNNRRRSKRGGTSLTRGGAADDIDVIDSTIIELEDKISDYTNAMLSHLKKGRKIVDTLGRTAAWKQHVKLARTNKIDIQKIKSTIRTLKLQRAELQRAAKAQQPPSGSILSIASNAVMAAEQVQREAAAAAAAAEEEKKRDDKLMKELEAEAAAELEAEAAANPDFNRIYAVSNLLENSGNKGKTDQEERELQAELDALVANEDQELEDELDALLAEQDALVAKVAKGGKKTRKVRRKKRKTCKKGKKCKKNRRRSTRRKH